MENEIREAIFQIEHNKVPGPNGFLAELYQVFWNVMKDDLCLCLMLSIRESYLFSALILAPLYSCLNVKMLCLYNNTYRFVY
jgi:hypothetical protein